MALPVLEKRVISGALSAVALGPVGADGARVVHSLAPSYGLYSVGGRWGCFRCLAAKHSAVKPTCGSCGRLCRSLGQNGCCRRPCTCLRLLPGPLGLVYRCLPGSVYTAQRSRPVSKGSPECQSDSDGHATPVGCSPPGVAPGSGKGSAARAPYPRARARWMQKQTHRRFRGPRLTR